MNNFAKHLKSYMFRGFLASIPLALSFFVLNFFYIFIDKKASDFVYQVTGVKIPGLGIAIFLVALYLIGFFASNIVGRRILGFIENILSRVPIINTTYHIGKQLSATLSLPEQQVIKKVVLVEFFKPNVWSVGFVTGSVTDRANGEKLLKVFISTTPTPATGFLAMVNESQVMDPGWTIEDGLKAVISGGIIGPDEIRERVSA